MVIINVHFVSTDDNIRHGQYFLRQDVENHIFTLIGIIIGTTILIYSNKNLNVPPAKRMCFQQESPSSKIYKKTNKMKTILALHFIHNHIYSIRSINALFSKK